MRSTQSLIISVTLFALPLLVAGCGSLVPTTTTTNTSTAFDEVSFSVDIQPLFNIYCVVCHQGASASEGLNLESGVSYQNLVNRQSTQSSLARVSPGDTQSSYLWHKINGTQGMVGGSGARMPYNSPQLSQENLNLIKQWIEAGSKDD